MEGFSPAEIKEISGYAIETDELPSYVSVFSQLPGHRAEAQNFARILEYRISEGAEVTDWIRNEVDRVLRILKIVARRTKSEEVAFAKQTMQRIFLTLNPEKAKKHAIIEEVKYIAVNYGLMHVPIALIGKFLTIVDPSIRAHQVLFEEFLNKLDKMPIKIVQQYVFHDRPQVSKAAGTELKRRIIDELLELNIDPDTENNMPTQTFIEGAEQML